MKLKSIDWSSPHVEEDCLRQYPLAWVASFDRDTVANTKNWDNQNWKSLMAKLLYDIINWAFTHSFSSTCLGFGILYPFWSRSAIWRGFISGYGVPPTEWRWNISFIYSFIEEKERLYYVISDAELSLFNCFLNNIVYVSVLIHAYLQ